MHILVRAKGFPMTEAIDHHVRNRAHFILSRFNNIVKKVEVFVADVNGPKGGIDKSCLVKIKTDHRSELIVKDIEGDLYIAINRAFARAKQSLSRHNQQTQKWKRSRQKSLSKDRLLESEQTLIQH